MPTGPVAQHEPSGVFPGQLGCLNLSRPLFLSPAAPVFRWHLGAKLGLASHTPGSDLSGSPDC